MALAWKSSQIFTKKNTLISQITSMNDIEEEAYVKLKLISELRLDWFLKSLMSLIAKDVATTMPQTKEEDITKSQHFDLIYSWFVHLYTFLPDAP
jgi:hypothetical protein